MGFAAGGAPPPAMFFFLFLFLLLFFLLAMFVCFFLSQQVKGDCLIERVLLVWKHSLLHNKYILIESEKQKLELLIYKIILSFPFFFLSQMNFWTNFINCVKKKKPKVINCAILTSQIYYFIFTSRHSNFGQNRLCGNLLTHVW
jgi:hypothetical protein